MDKLKAMKLFVRVAELGSFSKAAEDMQTSKSSISKLLTALEKDIGAKLLHRTTRQLRLTQTGTDYLQSCREILRQLEDAESSVQESQQQPKGRLRINTAMALALSSLAPAFTEFMRLYPDIKLDVHLSDEAQDLLTHNFDLGLRVASQPFDSTYIGKVIAEFDYSICASPDYLETHAPIKYAKDLQQHNCFEYSYFRSNNSWPIGHKNILIHGQLKANSSTFILEMVKQGAGIGFIPRFISYRALETGQLVEVLKNEHKPSMYLYALYPTRDFLPPRLKVFIAFLQGWIAQHPNVFGYSQDSN